MIIVNGKKIDLNDKIIFTLNQSKRQAINENKHCKEVYEKLLAEKASEKELEITKRSLMISFDEYNQANANLKEYEQKYKQVVKEFNSANRNTEKLESYVSDLEEFENKMYKFYPIEKEQEQAETSKNKNKKQKRSPLSMIALVVALLSLGHVLGTTHYNNTQIVQLKNQDDEDEKEKKHLELGEPGTFLDATDDEQVIARAKWYYKNFFNKEFENLSDSKKERVSEENLADMIKIVQGKEMIYQNTDPEEMNNYQNILGDMFCNYLSLSDRNWGFIPTQYLFTDDSVEAKAAAQVDAVMEPLINAMNKENDEEVVKYAKQFGELMRDQYYILSIKNDDTIAVRGNCTNASKYHLWKLSYKQYTTKIFEYCMEHGLNICIDFCTDYNTKKTVQISLSALMATLEKIPMDNWDAVLARAGITAKEVEKLGNKYSGLTMSNIFIEDARASLKSNMSLELK